MGRQRWAEKGESREGSPNPEVREGFRGSFEKRVGIVQAEEGALGRGNSLRKGVGVSELATLWKGSGARLVSLGGVAGPGLMQPPCLSGDLRAALRVDRGQDQCRHLQAPLPGREELPPVHRPAGHLWVRELCCEQVRAGLFSHNTDRKVTPLPLDCICRPLTHPARLLGNLTRVVPVGPLPFLPVPSSPWAS